jgi:hypothetical protein
MSQFKIDEDGHELFLIELDIVGIKGRVFVEVPGDNEEDAIEIALESIASKKANDCSVESISLILK